jgi:hypothetical protein
MAQHPINPVEHRARRQREPGTRVNRHIDTSGIAAVQLRWVERHGDDAGVQATE